MQITTIGRSCILLLLLLSVASPVSAQAWIEAFDRICSQAEVADSLPTANLRELIAESEKLLGVIEASDDPRKKVYVFRLKKCRNLFDYVISLRDPKGTPAPQQ